MIPLQLITSIRNLPYLNKVLEPINIIWRKRFERQIIKHPYRRFAHSHKLFYGCKANLENPRTLHEKIYWMAYCTDNTLWQKLTDKVTVRDWIRELGLEQYLNEVYQIWSTLPSYEDFVKALPNKCVVKTNHSATGEGVHIIRQKSTADLRQIYSDLQKELSTNYGVKTGQPHYIGIKPQIMVERFLENPMNELSSLPDYKFICINGEPLYIDLFLDRRYSDRKYHEQYFDANWDRVNFDKNDNTTSFQKPECFDEMLLLAKRLSKGFPFVRVDLYEVMGKPVFGEMTFTPGFNTFYGGYGNKVLKLGDLCDISNQIQTKPVNPEYY